MNYYEHHIGDYAAATVHLSLMEHGIYTRLLQIYYLREGPIPADQVMRLIGAREDGERSAARDVLNEFFVLDGDVYRNKRCDQEIARYTEKRDKAKASAGKRWDSERNANAVPTHSERIAPAVPPQSEGNALQSPVTSHQKEEPPNPRKRGQDDPAGFAQFWAAWPANTRKTARPQCLRKWLRLELEPMADRIVAAVERFKEAPDWLKDGGEFIPAPLVWLNQSRWEAVEALPAPVLVTASANEELARQREQQARSVPPPPEVLARLRGVVKVAG